MSLIIVLGFISLVGPAGWWPHMCGSPPPPKTSSQEDIFDWVDHSYENVTLPHNDCCRVTLTSSHEHRIAVSLSISKWLLKSDMSLQFCCLLVLSEHFCNSTTSSAANIYPSGQVSDVKGRSIKLKRLVILLLLLSGNVETNLGPDTPAHCYTPADFKSRTGLGLIHINARSLLNKMDLLKVWINSTNADVIVLSETWLTKSVLDKDISVNGYNVYRADRPRKGGGVAMYIRSNFDVNLVLKESVSKELELLALEIELTKNHRIMLVGCYRPPSAPKNALSSLVKFLSQLKYRELLLVGDLNWDWLMPVSFQMI
ncbi:uncharacterized protein LOC131969177 [Centropristis striata]|uniref:uncharacterized protein LOC131969177 n=1 Tax=Centropristis striata TaxID=184440 RepID=UPI0027E14EED|nr:uncharacterized protein LOC131969177 [Centropristis striata]